MRNEAMEPLAFELALELGADFADIISVKEHDFALGDPRTRRRCPPLVEPRFDADANQFVFRDRERPTRRR